MNDKPLTRGQILDEAKKIITSERTNQYGEPEDSFKIIAEFFETYVNNKCCYMNNDRPSVKFSGYDIAVLMSLLKISRLAGGNGSLDTWIDLAGYAACGGEIYSKENNNVEQAPQSPHTMIGFFANDLLYLTYHNDENMKIFKLLADYSTINGVILSLIFSSRDSKDLLDTKKQYLHSNLFIESTADYVEDFENDIPNWIIVTFDPDRLVKLQKKDSNKKSRYIFITSTPEYYTVDDSISMVQSLDEADSIIRYWLKNNGKDDEK